MNEPVHIFGIRHHGPGSARSLLRALETVKPDIVLIEGPPDAESVIEYAANAEMKAPAAILVYRPDMPRRAAFFPFAAFSPEWSAMRFALNRKVPVRFIDLPHSHQLADVPADDGTDPQRSSYIPPDPLAILAEAAGYIDSELWWEKMVEHRSDDRGIFEAILEAMTALRQELDENPDITERRREASMRQAIRKAKKESFSNIAVVCGAWHSPVLGDLKSTAKSDAELLANLPKVPVAATWVPWTHARLSYSSGYGAGIESPGWYAHLWQTTTDVESAWMTKVSRLLREHDLSASPAHIVEAVRLAESLCSLRHRAKPGLAELNESAEAVFSFGSHLPLSLIHDKLIVGDDLGAVPLNTPKVPLQRDFEQHQKSLRLAPDAAIRDLDLDLRKEIDLNRSRMLHRLELLDIDWGNIRSGVRGKGTFHELWKLEWRPEFAVSIIEASIWGNSIVDAADNRTVNLASTAHGLSALCRLLERALLAELPSAIQTLIKRVEEESAATNDVVQMLESFTPLAKIARYGNVRQTSSALIDETVRSLALRISIGLPAATQSLDDDAACVIYELIKKFHSSIRLLQNQEFELAWLNCAVVIVDSSGVHGLIAGRCCRILMDSGTRSHDETFIKLHRAINEVDPQAAAAWIEGFLSNSGQLLMLDDILRTIIDRWVCSLTDESFEHLLPLIRRTFSTFEKPERRAIGEKIKRSDKIAVDADHRSSQLFDPRRLSLAMPLLNLLLGDGKEARV